MKWVRPKTPPKINRGMIEIHTDDGWLGDYTHWLPHMIKVAKNHSDWLRSVPLNAAINTNNIDADYYMKWSHVKEIYRCGGEIHSHGRYHITIGSMILVTDISAGSSKVTVADNRFQQGTNKGFKYDIYDTDGTISETFELVGGSGKDMFTKTPLTKSHSKGAKVQITINSTNDLVLGAKNDIESYGMTCNSHTYTWGDFDAIARDRVSLIMDSARRSPGGNGYTHKKGADLFNLTTNPIETYFTNSELDKIKVDGLLDKVSSEDSFAIIRGHGDKGQQFLDTLGYIIEQCMFRGIKIVTRQEAIKLLQ